MQLQGFLLLRQTGLRGHQPEVARTGCGQR